MFFLLDREDVLKALALQREKFEACLVRKAKAREASDLVLLSLYVHIPPSRCLEIRTLEVMKQEEITGLFQAASFRERNILLLNTDRSATLHLQRYKTWRHHGHEEIPIQVSGEFLL